MAVPGLIGRWKVHVRQWNWFYDFDGGGGVRWTDPANGLTGKGTWRLVTPTLLRTSWPSGTQEDWPVPLQQQAEKGTCRMDGIPYDLEAVFVPPSTSDTYARSRPPIASQGNARLCWAAALQSWLSATVGANGEEEGTWTGAAAEKNHFNGLPWRRKIYALQDMINMWGDQLHTDKSQTAEGIRIITLDVGMDGDLVLPSSITPSYISERLKRGYLYIVYFSRVSYHAVVAYGVASDGIDLMDPLPSEGFKKRSFEFFKEPVRVNHKMLVGWAVRGTAAGPSEPPSKPTEIPAKLPGSPAGQKLYYATILMPLWRGQLDELGRIAREYRVHLLALECLRRAKGSGIDSVKVAEFCKTWKVPLTMPFISAKDLLKKLIERVFGLPFAVFDITGAINHGIKIMAEMGPLLEKLQMNQALLIAFDDNVIEKADQTDVGSLLESSSMPKPLFDSTSRAKDRLEAKWKEITDQAARMEAIRVELGLPEDRA